MALLFAAHAQGEIFTKYGMELRFVIADKIRLHQLLQVLTDVLEMLQCYDLING